MTIRLAVLGDSIAAGRGASRRTDTAAARLAHRLRGEGATVTTRVFATHGARSTSLADQAERAAGWRPTVAVIIIGATDLLHHTHAGRAARQLGDAVRRLRECGAEVVVAPAPDLSALPDIPAGLKPVLRSASMLLRDTQIIAARAAGAHVADRDHATARAFAADRSLFCADRFHPSSAGYAVIAQALYPAVSAALAPREERTGRATTHRGIQPMRSAASIG
jgi:lysophospholipase L1-like esterase